jgi:hypothetical protein
VIAGSLSATPPSGTAHVRLIVQNSTVHNAEKFSTELEIVRGADTEPLQVSLAIHQRITSRSSFRKTAAGNDLGPELGASDAVDVPAVPNSSVAPVINVPLAINLALASTTSDTPSTPSTSRISSTSNSTEAAPSTSLNAPKKVLVLAEPGVYPVRVTLRRPTPNPTVIDAFTTYVSVVNNTNTGTGGTQGSEQFNVALIVPIHLQPAIQPTGTNSEPNTAEVIALTEALVRRPIPAVSIAVTPESVKTLARQANDENPDRRSQVLDQLRSALNGREIIGGPFVEPSPPLLDDPNLQAERQRQRLAGDTAITRYLAAPVPGLIVFDKHIPAAKSLADFGATAIITSTQALAFGNPNTSGRKDFTTSTNNSLQQESEQQSLDVLANKAAATQPVALHLNEPKVIRTPTNVAGKDQTVKAIVVDQLLAQRCIETLDKRSPKDDNTLRAQQFLAELSFLRSEIPRDQRSKHGITVAIPSATTSATLDAILAGIGADDGMFRAVPISTILALPTSKVLQFQRRDTTNSLLEPNLHEELRTIQTKLWGYNAMFSEPRGEAQAVDQGLRTVLAADRAPKDRKVLLANLRTQANAMLGELALVQSKSLTLTAREQTVKVAILNNLEQASNAILDVQSDSIEFVGAQIDPDQPRRSHLSLTVRLTDRVQQIPIRVRTRGPGSFSFVAKLHTPAIEGSPDGVAISSRRYTLRSTAVGGLRSIIRRRRLDTRASQDRHPSSAPNVAVLAEEQLTEANGLSDVS